MINRKRNSRHQVIHQSLLIRSFLIFCFFLFSITAITQEDTCNYTVAGKILDKDTKEPLPYVTVEASGTQKHTLTDIKGNFEIDDLCDSSNILIISCLGYCNTSCENHHQHGKTPHIYLTQEVKKLGTVIIEAKKTKEEGTETISQITLKKEDISQDLTQSLAATIADQQGISLTSTGTNVQLPVIHGLYGNRILILNNGLKHAFQNWGTDHGPEIDISSAHALTIIKGAAGVRYGPEALGGVISIENAPLYLNESFETKIGSGYQSNGKGYYSNIAINQGLKKWSYYTGANYTKIGDRHTPEYIMTNTSKEEKSINLGLRYHLDNIDLKTYYSFLDQDLALLRSSIAHSGNSIRRALNSDLPIIIEPFSYNINEPKQEAQHHLAKTELKWVYSDHANITFRYGRQFNQRKEYDVRRNSEVPIINLDLTTNDFQVEWKHPHILKLDGLIGLHSFSQLNDNKPGTNTTPIIPNYKTNRWSGFIIENFKKNSHTIEGGLRVDYENNFVAGRTTSQGVFIDEFNFSNLTVSMGYIKKLSLNNSISMNIGTAWRTPNMSELYSFGQHGFKTSYGLLRYYYNEEGEPRTDQVLSLSQSNVQAEKGYKWITEFKSKRKKNTHVLTAYSHYIQNYTFERPLGVFGTIRGPMPTFVFQQADALFIGSDYTWKKNWTKQTIGTFGASYLWSQNLENKEVLINQPPISLHYKIAYNQGKFWKFKALKIMINARYVFKQFQAPRTVTPEELINGTIEITPDTEIFDFRDAPEGYFIMNIAWNFAFQNLKGSISANNLFNARYRDYMNEMRYFADETGSNILFTLNYTIK